VGVVRPSHFRRNEWPAGRAGGGTVRRIEIRSREPFLRRLLHVSISRIRNLALCEPRNARRVPPALSDADALQFQLA